MRTSPEVRAVRRRLHEQAQRCPRAFALRQDVGHVLNEGQLWNALEPLEENELLSIGYGLEVCLDKMVDVGVADEAHVRARLDVFKAKLPQPPECSICRGRHGLEIQHASE